MTMTKDRSGRQRSTADEATPAQDSMNELYAAHQIHTLAHLVYRRLSEGWSTAPGAVPRPVVHAYGAPVPHVHPMPVPGPAILYWYP
jgi:hypothetical protein